MGCDGRGETKASVLGYLLRSRADIDGMFEG